MAGNNGLPQGWAIKSLDNLGEFLTGVTYKKDDASKEPQEGYLPVLRANNINNELNFDKLVYVPKEKIKDEQLIRKHDIVICMSSGSKHLVGKAAQAENDYDGAFGAFCGLFRCSSEVEPKYIGYFFQSPNYRYTVSEASKGVNINNLRRAHIESMEIPVPPHPEQERIVAKLEETFTQLEAAVDELQNAKAQLNRYRAAVLKSAVEGELTREWREAHQGELEPAEKLLARILSARREKWEAEGKKGKYKEPAAPDPADLPELPDGWVWARLEQLAWNASYGTSQKCNYESDGPPVIRIPNISNGYLNFDDLKFATKSEELSEEKAIAPHDLLIIRTNGSVDLIGRAALVRNKPDTPHYFASYLIRYRLVETSNFSPWISLIWDSHFVRNWMVREAATTAGQYNVSVSKLNRLSVPLPPIEEQRRLVAMVERRLSVADEIEKELEEALVRAERLRGSILKNAFEGKF